MDLAFYGPWIPLVVEATLAQVFKVRWHDGTFRGGPAFYMQRALEKSGFVRCGRIYTEDGSPRWAYYHKAATQKASHAGEAVRAADG